MSETMFQITARPMGRAERKAITDIGQLILDACVGVSGDIALNAQSCAIAHAVGFLHFQHGYSIERAEAAIDEMAEQAKRHIRENWGNIEEQICQ